MGEHELSDVDLLAAAQRDAEALGRFYDRHERSLLGFFVRRTGNAEVAADLTAETFARVVMHCRQGRPVDAPLAWLYRIAYHELVNYDRRGRVAKRARDRLGMEQISPDAVTLAQIEALVEDPRAEALPTALASLPLAEREAVIARHIDGAPYSDIAASQQITEQAARKRVSRALARLRRLLKEPKP